MASQLLVNVLNVGPVAPGATVSVPHGLKVAGVGVPPSQVICDRASPLGVIGFNATTITVENFDLVNPASASFRAEFDHSIHAVGAPTVAWQGYVTPTSLPPSGPAGGDLNGTYPDPTVDGLQGRPVDPTAPAINDSLTWDGTKWTHLAVGAGAAVAVFGSYSLNAASTTVPVTPLAPLAVPFDTVEGENGVSLVAGTQITVAQAGVYEINFSPQLTHAGGSASEVFMWLRLNGTTPVPRSSSDVRLANNNDTLFLFIAVTLSLNAGDYLEWMMQSSAAGPTTMITIAGTGAGATARPVTPAVIASIKRLGA